MPKINVIIADDHPIILLGLRKIVEAHGRFKVLGEASDSNQLVSLLKQQPVDLVLTDYNMPGDSPYGDGLKMVGYIARHYPRIKILILTMISNSLTLARLKELNVYGVIQKKQMSQEIDHALLAIVLNQPYRNSLTPIDAYNVPALSINERISTLTARELEIIRLFVSGKSVSEIAGIQNRSGKTISAQKVSAMRKLDVKSDQDLVLYCSDNSTFI